MNENTQNVRTFSHMVRVPIMTDVPQMIGAYRTLFESCGVNCSALGTYFPASVGFTHPIETENQKLLADFMQTMPLIETAMLSYGSIQLINVRTTESTVNFIFQYKE